MERPSATWRDGTRLARRKEIRPFHINGAGVEWTRPEGLAPLYALPELLSGGSRVLLVAGEKTRDAAKKRFPGWNVTTHLGGENAEAKSDWSSVRGKHVTVWHDADDTGCTAPNFSDIRLRYAASCIVTVAAIQVRLASAGLR